MTEPGKQSTINDGKRNAIRVLLADDHKILRSGLRILLEKNARLDVIAEAETGRLAVKMCRELAPDVVIMDISMPELNGMEATRQILNNSPQTKIVILSVHSGQRFVKEVFKAGAVGYLLKDCAINEVVSAIDAVLANGIYLCPQIATIVRDDYLRHVLEAEKSESSTLTPREREVLQLTAEGKSTKEIAFELKLSVKTVETHRQRIMDKLDIRTVAGLTKYAIREGLTSLEN